MFDQKRFVAELAEKMSKFKFRADLSLSTNSRRTDGIFQAVVAFNPDLSYPSEKDLTTIVAQHYPTHEIDWELCDLDEEQGHLALTLKPSVAVVPIESVSKIPSEFKAIGTGLYRKASDPGGTVSEIWELKKGEDGLFLYRKETEVMASSDEIATGDIVSFNDRGEEQLGRVTSVDEAGNAYVMVGNRKRLVAAQNLNKYEVTAAPAKDEAKKLLDYYTKAYGDAEYAKQLVREFSSKKKKASMKRVAAYKIHISPEEMKSLSWMAEKYESAEVLYNHLEEVEDGLYVLPEHGAMEYMEALEEEGMVVPPNIGGELADKLITLFYEIV